MSDFLEPDLGMTPEQLINIKLARHMEWVRTIKDGDDQKGERLFWSGLTNPEKKYFLATIDLSSRVIPHIVYRGADFEQKEMPRVRFSKCLMFRANFQKAFFPFAIFSACDLNEAEMPFTPEIFTVSFRNNDNIDKIKFFNTAGIKLKGVALNPATGLLEKREVSIDEMPSIKEGCAAVCDFDKVYKEAWKKYPKEMTFLGYKNPFTPKKKELALQV